MSSYFRDPRFAGTGLAWYRRQDYPRILQIMADAELLPPTFDKWQGKAEKLEREIARKGGKPVRVQIDPDKFVAWCTAHGHDVDAAGRRAFAADPTNWGDGQRH